METYKDIKVALNINTAFDLAYSKSWDSFKLERGKLYFYGVIKQNVCNISRLDKKLLNKSLSALSIFERECLEIRIHTALGEVICSHVIKGERSRVSNINEIRTLSKNMIFESKKVGHGISFVEVVHTHLNKQFVTVNQNGLSKIEVQGLSEMDIHCLGQLAEFIDYPFKASVVTREGMKFSAFL